MADWDTALVLGGRMFEGFTEAAHELVALAQEEARILRHGHIGSEHLVLGFLRVRPGALRLRGRRSITLVALRRAVTHLAGTGLTAQLAAYLPYSPHAAGAIASASVVAREGGREQVEPEHVLLALLGQAEKGSGAGKVLAALGGDLPELSRQTSRALDETAVGRAGEAARATRRARMPQLLAGTSSVQMDTTPGRKRLALAVACGVSAPYAIWSLTVNTNGRLATGERRLLFFPLLLLVMLLLGMVVYYGAKHIDSVIEGWRIASLPARVFLPVCYIIAGLFPLVVAAGIAVSLDMVVYGKRPVWHLLIHLGSVSVNAETLYALLVPLALCLGGFLLFVPHWHYSWTPFLAFRKIDKTIDSFPDDLPGGITPFFDARLDKMWRRRYSSFGTELLNILTLSIRTLMLALDSTIYGRADLLGEAAANARAAAEVCLRNPQRARNYMFTEVGLTGLADALWLLYQVRPDRDALDDAIWARHRVAEATAYALLSRTDHKVNAGKLAELLAARFEIAADQKDLTEALGLAQSARHIRKGEFRAEALLTLGRIEQIRFGLAQARSDLDAALSAFDAAAQAYREAAAASDTEGEAEYRLAVLLAARAGTCGDETCRQEALTILRPLAEKAAAFDPDGDEFIYPEKRAKFMIGLADVLALPAAPQEPEAGSVMNDPAAWYERAARVTEAPVQLRLAAACGWGKHARDAAAAAAGFDEAVRLLQLVVWPGLSQSAQVRLLTRWPELTADAAAAQVAAGRPERAVEVLEQGRILMWSQRMALRSAPLDRLREADPVLFGRLTAIRAELNASVIGGSAGTVRFGRSNAGAERRAALYREWDDSARRHDLLRSPSYQELRAAAACGPVVLLNASLRRCDALVVTRDLPVHQLGLPGDIYQRIRAIAAAWERAAKARSEAELTEARAVQQRMGDDMLAWLWRDVADPVLRWLADHGQLQCRDGALPRVWWCPAGWFAHLPLHAAGLPGPAGNSVLDRVASSYTPSLSQLIRARQASTEPSRADRAPQQDEPSPDAGSLPGTSGQMLILAPDGGGDLPRARLEAALVDQLFPGGLWLPGDTGKAAYLREIGCHQLLHFVGHGSASDHEQISGDVRAGGLVLNPAAGVDGFISPRELSELGLHHARFAYLSICDAAAPDRMLPDEAVHPAAALHFAGFTHVIATLSLATDRQAMSVAKTVYTALARGGTLDESQSAHALHHAVCEARGHRRGHWGPWTTYLHIGP